MLCGHLDAQGTRELRNLFPSIRVVALTATTETLLQRARRRSRRKEIWLPGDDLYGRDDVYLRETVLQEAPFDPEQADLVVGTDGLTPDDIAVFVTSLWERLPL